MASPVATPDARLWAEWTRQVGASPAQAAAWYRTLPPQDQRVLQRLTQALTAGSRK